VALAIDANYLPWAATLVSSTLAANPGEAVAIHILHDGSVTDADQARMQSLAANGPSTVSFLGVEPGRLTPLPSTSAFGPIVWLRFLIPELLPEARRVLYLDSDTFVASALRPLWETDLGESPLGAVANVVEPDMRDHVASLCVAYPGGFFNSGVLLLDLDRMRAEGAADALLGFAHDHRDSLLWPDQDALNSVFDRRWFPLDPRWNAQNSFWVWHDWSAEVFDEVTLEQAMAHPGIRHFEGPSVAKPWHYLCPYPGQREYRAALAATPWAGTPPIDRTIATRLIRHLPEGLRMPAYRRLIAWRAHPTPPRG
jgi:lipopolysaccharide biosynthesis glycosyltransferase